MATGRVMADGMTSGSGFLSRSWRDYLACCLPHSTKSGGVKGSSSCEPIAKSDHEGRPIHGEGCNHEKFGSTTSVELSGKQLNSVGRCASARSTTSKTSSHKVSSSNDVRCSINQGFRSDDDGEGDNMVASSTLDSTAAMKEGLEIMLEAARGEAEDLHGNGMDNRAMSGRGSNRRPKTLIRDVGDGMEAPELSAEGEQLLENTQEQGQADKQLDIRQPEYDNKLQGSINGRGSSRSKETIEGRRPDESLDAPDIYHENDSHTPAALTSHDTQSVLYEHVEESYSIIDTVKDSAYAPTHTAAAANTTDTAIITTGINASIASADPAAPAATAAGATTVTSCGRVRLTFQWDRPRARMWVTIHEALDLPSKDRGGASSMQAKLLLLPTQKPRHKTKVRQSDQGLQFDETFEFKISEDDVADKGIWLRLYGCERLRRDRLIGESIISFAALSLIKSTFGTGPMDEVETVWAVLEPRTNLTRADSLLELDSPCHSDSGSSVLSLQHAGLPELMIGLSYNGSTGRLSVEVIKGSNFKTISMTRPPDSRVKMTLLAPNGVEITRCKTSVRRGQPNPLFKETFMFQVALFQLAQVSLMTSVFIQRSLKRKEMIGWFTMGHTNSSEEEGSHWQEMIDSCGHQICRWHVLLEP